MIRLLVCHHSIAFVIISDQIILVIIKNLKVVTLGV